MKVYNRYFGIFFAIVVLIGATGASYLILHHFYESAPRIAPAAPEAPKEGRGGEPVPRTEVPAIFPMSLGIGIAMAGVSLVFWEGSRRTGGDATTVLLEAGLGDMTVRDVEVVRRVIEKGEFTVPELVEDSPVSRSSVWHLVKKLAEKELVEEKEETDLSDRGRGKPRKVYEYVGP